MEHQLSRALIGHAHSVANGPSVSDIFAVITMLMIIILGLVANIILLWTFATKRYLTKTNHFYIYIINLALTDLSVAIIGMTLSVVVFVVGYWPFGNAACYFWLFCDFCTYFVSCSTVTLICIDRCSAITNPISYRHSVSKRKAIILIALIW